MKRIVIAVFLLLSACASVPKSDPAASIGVYAKPGEIQAAYGDYGKIAVGMNMYEPFVGAIKEKVSTDEEIRRDPQKLRFMIDLFNRFDEKSFNGVLVGVLKKHYTASEAKDIGQFLETPQGREGMKVAISMYLASKGKQKAPALSADLEAAWAKFMTTPSGKKFLTELPKVSTEFTAAIDQWSRKVITEAAAQMR